MRRRSTFIHSASYEFNPAEIELTQHRLQHPGIQAAREERLRFHIHELPPDLNNILQQTRKFHLRWIPEITPGSVSPFVSRLPPGLHIQYSVAKQKVVDLDVLLGKTFSKNWEREAVPTRYTDASILSGHNVTSNTHQYYSLLPTLEQFITYIQENICPQSNQQCTKDAALLRVVDYLDLDYDSESRALILTAFWSQAPPTEHNLAHGQISAGQWTLDMSTNDRDKVEVGILSSMPPFDPHDVQLAGFLTVIGNSERPKSAQFSFPSRHHILSNTQAAKQGYAVSFQKPTGLHPTLEISFPSTLSLEPPTNRPAGSECTLNAYLKLPSSIFPDKYAFTAKDPLFEKSHNLRSVRNIEGELDLEAPDYVVRGWGSNILLELATPDEDATAPVPDIPWNVTIPLHLRYQPPARGGFDEIHVPWPIVFWECTADEDVKLSGNPFDRVKLGYDGWFGPNTMFYHLKPVPNEVNGGRLVESIKVPVLDTTKTGKDNMIEQATLIVIVLGFGWVLFKLWPGLSQQLGFGRASRKEKAGAAKKKQ